MSEELNKDITILVTGGAGLVGSELIRQLLSQGNKIRAIYNSNPLPNFHSTNLEPVHCDILDVIRLREAMKGIRYVYHSAAIISFHPSEKRKLFQVNVEGTANIVNACLEEGVEKLVHVSSVAALGRTKNNQEVTEEMNWDGNVSYSAYGKSKQLGEMEVWRGTGEGLKAVVVNPSIVLGGDNWEYGSSALFKSAYDEFPWYTTGSTGFVNAKDVARAMILLMNSEITNERFILNGANIGYKELFTYMAERFAKKPPYKKVSPFIAGLVWRKEAIKAAFTGKSPLLTRETAATAQANVSYNTEKIRSFLPAFQFTPIEKTIEDTCATLKEKYHL
jgi:dihydroflavonol-4-reductase